MSIVIKIMPITTLFPHLAALQALQSSCLWAALPVAVMGRSFTKHVRSALGLAANKFIQVRILPVRGFSEAKKVVRKERHNNCSLSKEWDSVKIQNPFLQAGKWIQTRDTDRKVLKWVITSGLYYPPSNTKADVRHRNSARTQKGEKRGEKRGWVWVGKKKKARNKESLLLFYSHIAIF